MSTPPSLYKLAPGAIVELYVVDATPIGGAVHRFHAGANALSADVVWQGETFEAFPFEAEGWERSGRGTLPRPVVRIANVTGIISGLLREHRDLVGAKVIRKRTLVQYLDAANFPGGTNPSADANAHWPDETWFIRRKIRENAVIVELELGAPIDVVGVTLPNRRVVRQCPWEYRQADCGYVGPAVAKIDDTPTADIDEDRCSKSLRGCRLRWGASAELPFGGFPAAGLIR
ncbi:MAG: phage minor tail protein L [Burkholderiales bacterium]|nr:phage minor tail protein L [Burkholderiales bacterium]